LSLYVQIANSKEHYTLFCCLKAINEQMYGSFINTNGEQLIFIAKSSGYHMMKNLGYILAVN
tara:strand:+ start:952 stop:1137 length:186 start_codon:yes stop_codon:yes gene_type:complete